MKLALTAAAVVLLFAFPAQASTGTSTNESVIRSVFGKYGAQAVAVARCESGSNVYAMNGQYEGLFQMGSYARTRYGHAWNAWAQARSAFAYFRDSGYRWTAWSCGWAAR